MLSSSLFSKKWSILLVVTLLMAGGYWFYSKNKTEPERETLGEVTGSVREPSVAGAFYLADKQDLSDQIDGFFNNVVKQEFEGRLKILIVPHAGHSYSGQVAAFGFKQLQNQNYSTIVIIGNSHQARFSEAAVDGNKFWETPLGQVEVDSELAQKLISADQRIVENSSIHAAEHSLEVQLPFLQKVLPDFKIVPILLGDDDKVMAEEIAKVLAQNIDDSTLVIISSDLSHYPSYEDANEIDKKTIDAILTGDIEKLEEVISNSMSEGVPNLATCACGEGAIKVGIFLAEELGISDRQLLKYANSGDVSGDLSKVVGYAAIGFYDSHGGPISAEVRPHGTVELIGDEQKELLKISRSTLESYIKEGKVPEVLVEHLKLEEKLGAFVTLRKNGQLRGCIGRFEPDEPLWKVVQNMTIAAAIEDSRFTPVTLDELNDISIEVSVMAPKQKITDPQEIELGKHGVVIQKGLRSGVFLPQVATETGWDFETFMGQLCSQKAGLPWDCWKDPSVSLYTFTAQVFKEEE